MGSDQEDVVEAEEAARPGGRVGIEGPHFERVVAFIEIEDAELRADRSPTR